jgi:hypothetical protein
LPKGEHSFIPSLTPGANTLLSSEGRTLGLHPYGANFSPGDQLRVLKTARGPFLTSPLPPRGEICPLGKKFTPLLTPRGEHSLLFRRMEGRTENFTPRG